MTAGTPAAKEDAELVESAAMTRRSREGACWRRLTGSIDPELDEPITTLRFVSSCEVTPDGDVEVRCGCRRRSALPTSRS